MPDDTKDAAATAANPVEQFQHKMKVEEIRSALRNIVDPEIGQNIVDLGLIYDVSYNEQEQHSHVKMTLTSPMCPYGPMLLNQVPIVAQTVPGVKEADVEVVWTPPWDPSRMSDEARVALNMW